MAPADLEIPILQTERLRVRPLVEADLDACLALYDSIGWLRADASAAEHREELGAWLAWTVASYAQLARLCQPPYGERGIELQASGALIGMVGLVPSFNAFAQLPTFGGAPANARRAAHVGLFWLLGKAHQGHGYATEAARALADCAFDRLHVEQLVATTEHDNLASIAVMRRLGMQIETNPHPEPPHLQVVGVLRAG